MEPRRVLIGLVTALVVLLASPACTREQDAGTATDGASVTVEADPPWGLDAVPTPADQEEIDAVIAAMPAEVDGLAATSQGNEIAYGDPGMGEVSGSMETFLRIMTIGGQEYGDGASFVGAIAQSGGLEVEGQELDPDAAIVYLAGLIAAGDVTYASVMWADPAAPYVLLIQGTSPEQRDALVAASREAATTALG